MDTVEQSTDILEKHGLHMGDVLIIEHREWRIAEIQVDKIILYREGIDGSSRIEQLTEPELIAILEAQPL